MNHSIIDQTISEKQIDAHVKKDGDSFTITWYYVQDPRTILEREQYNFEDICIPDHLHEQFLNLKSVTQCGVVRILRLSDLINSYKVNCKLDIDHAPFWMEKADRMRSYFQANLPQLMKQITKIEALLLTQLLVYRM